MVLTISGKKNKMRVYFLSWLRNKILKNDPAIGKKPGYSSIGDLEGITARLIKYQFTGYFRMYNLQIDKLSTPTLSCYSSRECYSNVCLGTKTLS